MVYLFNWRTNNNIDCKYLIYIQYLVKYCFDIFYTIQILDILLNNIGLSNKLL